MYVCSRFREKLGVKTVKALKRNNNGVTHAAVDMLCALMCVSITCISRHQTTANTQYISTAFLSSYCWPETFSFMFLCSRCTMTMTWGRSSWTKPLCCPPRSSWRTFWKSSSLMWYCSFYCLNAGYKIKEFRSGCTKVIKCSFIKLLISCMQNINPCFFFVFFFFRTMEQELWSSAPYWTS